MKPHIDIITKTITTEAVSMKLLAANLINYAHISQIYQHASMINTKIYVSADKVIHTKRINCPVCCNKCSYNGSNNSGNIVSRSIDSFFKKGQQCCTHCGKTYQIENKFVDSVKNDLDQLILSEALSLRRIFTSYPDISKHISGVYGIPISESTLKTICEKKLYDFEDLEIDFAVEDDFYGYDEQYLTVGGKKAYRIVIFDFKNNKPIYEAKHEDLTKDVLKNILKEVFPDKAPKGFIFDMRSMYPDAFKEVFGKKIMLQYCVFHLNKLILLEYQKALKVGKRVKWTLIQYRKMYSLFNIFYDRKQELDFMECLEKELDCYKEKFKGIEDIDSYFKNVNFPKNCKTRENKIAYCTRMYEKELMSVFREHLHNEKLRRKREKTGLKPRTKDDARNILNKIAQMSLYYPKALQKRIQMINDNFDLFTGSDGAYLTNNKLEGFFGSTLKKFRKKDFHSDDGLKNYFTFRKIKQSGINIIEQFSILRLANIFSITAFFRQPT